MAWTARRVSGDWDSFSSFVAFNVRLNSSRFAAAGLPGEDGSGAAETPESAWDGGKSITLFMSFCSRYCETGCDYFLGFRFFPSLLAELFHPGQPADVFLEPDHFPAGL